MRVNRAPLVSRFILIDASIPAPASTLRTSSTSRRRRRDIHPSSPPSSSSPRPLRTARATTMMTTTTITGTGLVSVPSIIFRRLDRAARFRRRDGSIGVISHRRRAFASSSSSFGHAPRRRRVTTKERNDRRPNRSIGTTDDRIDRTPIEWIEHGSNPDRTRSNPIEPPERGGIGTQGGRVGGSRSTTRIRRWTVVVDQMIGR